MRLFLLVVLEALVSGKYPVVSDAVTYLKHLVASLRKSMKTHKK